MKIRDSGMPERQLWQLFFEPEIVLKRLALLDPAASVVEFGSGYGTFTLPAARLTRGHVYAIDLEASLLQALGAEALAAGLANVRTLRRDFVEQGTGLPDESVDYAMLFNILHAEDPVALLQEAFRVLRPGKIVAIMHWQHDASTPRGPDLSIRPRPEQCQAWVRQAGFVLVQPLVPLPPYHYGIVGRKP